MAYDENFYRLYEEYLVEPRVREAHDFVFRVFTDLSGTEHEVVDLGCGRSQEFRRFAPTESWDAYLGLDVNAEDESNRIDYRNLDALFARLDQGRRAGYPPDVFVSLFSSEITAPAPENTLLYKELFKRYPSIRWGLVSGFYYHGRRGEQPIEEAGGITSWQTLHPLGRPAISSHLFEERRISLSVPSTMFGEDVVEVWRLLKRKND